MSRSLRSRALRLCLLAMLLVVFVTPALAIFGVGDIVFDPISYANALVMLSKLIASYEQLKAQLELQTWMAKPVPFDMSSRYGTKGTEWYSLKTPYDRFGNLGGWLSAVNQGGAALGGYNGASVALQDYGSAVSLLAADEQKKTASQYASIELADASNVHAMETIGMLRANAAVVDDSIKRLQKDSLSGESSLNTLIAVGNKTNAATVAVAQATRDTNRALMSIVEQQVIDSKLRRDASAVEVNAQIQRLVHGAEVKATYTDTITQSLERYRWK